MRVDFGSFVFVFACVLFCAASLASFPPVEARVSLRIDPPARFSLLRLRFPDTISCCSTAYDLPSICQSLGVFGLRVLAFVSLIVFPTFFVLVEFCVKQTSFKTSVCFQFLTSVFSLSAALTRGSHPLVRHPSLPSRPSPTRTRLRSVAPHRVECVDKYIYIKRDGTTG